MRSVARPLLRDTVGRDWGEREALVERIEFAERVAGSAEGAGAKAIAPPAYAKASAAAASCRIVEEKEGRFCEDLRGKPTRRAAPADDAGLEAPTRGLKC